MVKTAQVMTGEDQKQRKKQAKREAKLMLKLDAARGDFQRAEQKIAKARSRLDVARTQMQELENELAQLHGEQPPHDGEAAGEEGVVALGEVNYISEDIASIPPVEGRIDIEIETTLPAESSAAAEPEGGVSPEIREEIPGTAESQPQKKATPSSENEQPGEQKGEGTAASTDGRRARRGSSTRRTTQRKTRQTNA